MSLTVSKVSANMGFNLNTNQVSLLYLITLTRLTISLLNLPAAGHFTGGNKSFTLVSLAKGMPRDEATTLENLGLCPSST